MSIIDYKYWYFLGTFTFIVTTNLAVVLDIPYLRFVFGFCFLVLLPGFLILPVINIQKIGFFEKCLLIIGISIGFIYLYGLTVNTILVSMGYTQPLSTNSILITFSVMYVILILLGSTNQYYHIDTSKLLQFSSIEKGVLIFLFVLPAAIFVSMYVLSTQGNNNLLLGSLLTLPVFLLILTIYRDRVNEGIFPLSLLSISFSLLSIFMLRYQFIWGVDVQREYGLFFLTTYDNLYWTYLGSNLGTALSITLLPTIIHSICQVEYVELLFKSIYVFVCSFSPVAVYYAAKRYLDPFLAFCASLYFIFQFAYLHTAGSVRTNIAVFFCALTLYLLVNNNIERRLKKSLMMLFIVSIIVSHYSTAYIFFFILFVGILIITSVHEPKFKPNCIDYSILLFYFVFLISWTFLLLGGHSLTSGLEIVIDSVREFLTGSGFDLQTSEAKLIFSPTFKNKYLSVIHWTTIWSSFLFIGLGLLYSLIFYFRGKFHFPKFRRIPHFRLPDLGVGVGIEYIAFGAISVALLISLTLFQSMSESYDSSRLFSLTAIFLSPFLVIGIMYTVESLRKIRWLSNKPYFDVKEITRYCVIILIIGCYLFTLGLPYQIAGIQQSHLSQESIDYMQGNIYESEKSAAIWLKEKYDANTNILRPLSRHKELWSAGRFSVDSLRIQRYKNSYIYFGSFEIFSEHYDTYMNSSLSKQHKVFSSPKVSILYETP